MVLVVLAAGPATGQDAPRTPWGAPDLQGVWDFRTPTPLQRPEDRGDQAFLTEEEAASIEQERVERNIRLWEAPPRRHRVVDRRVARALGERAGLMGRGA